MPLLSKPSSKSSSEILQVNSSSFRGELTRSLKLDSSLQVEDTFRVRYYLGELSLTEVNALGDQGLLILRTFPWGEEQAKQAANFFHERLRPLLRDPEPKLLSASDRKVSFWVATGRMTDIYTDTYLGASTIKRLVKAQAAVELAYENAAGKLTHRRGVFVKWLDEETVQLATFRGVRSIKLQGIRKLAKISDIFKHPQYVLELSASRENGALVLQTEISYELIREQASE